MTRYTIAQAGIGHRGKVHANAILQLSDRFELVGLCDLDGKKLKAYADEKRLPDGILYDDAERMLQRTRPDVFCFVTPPDVRLSMVELAVRYGVRGLAFEKPMATSLREAWTITRLCRDHGIKAVVSHQQKYLTSMQRLKAIVDAGEVGEILYVNATCQAWLAQLGTHFMDYMLWANHRSRAKWAVGHVHGKELLSNNHPSPNYTMGHVEFQNGVRSFFEFGKLSASHMPKENFWLDNRLWVHGTHGYVWADTNGRWGAFTRNSGREVLGESGAGWNTQQSTRLQPLYFAEFADWLDGKVDHHSCDVEIAYHGYEVLEAVCISALEHRRIDLPLDPEKCADSFARMRQELPECPERAS